MAVAVSFVPSLVGPSLVAQDPERTCLVCHGDEELVSSAGTSVHVRPDLFVASVHGRAGLGCVGCHADLEGFEDFPHATDLAPVVCARCHAAYSGTGLAEVHAVPSPRLVSGPVQCWDCHGYHDVLPSTDPSSPAHAANLPATCGRCHPGAGANYAKGRVHDLSPSSGPSPAGLVRVLYKALIGAVTAFFLAYAGADVLRWRRER
jgi:hypothetical protein